MRKKYDGMNNHNRLLEAAKNRQTTLRGLFWYVASILPSYSVLCVFGFLHISPVIAIWFTGIYAANALWRSTKNDQNKFWYLWAGPIIALKNQTNVENSLEWFNYLEETFDKKDYHVLIQSYSWTLDPVVKFRRKKDAMLFKLACG